MNVTVTQATDRGYLTVHECGTTPPNTSNVNFVATARRTEPRDRPDRRNRPRVLTATRDAHIIVDLLAEFGASTTVEAATPERLADTRGGAAPVAGEIVRIDVDRRRRHRPATNPPRRRRA